MARILHKFPRTPHLAWLGPGLPRDDKVLSPEERALFLKGGLVIEEKADGANIGIGFDDTAEPVVWNRGAVLRTGAHPQFQAFWPWLAQRRCALWEAMQSSLILFGEWCFAVHSVHYDRLPDYFLAIDVYDRQAGRFWSSRRRDDWTARVGLSPCRCSQEAGSDWMISNASSTRQPPGWARSRLKESICAARKSLGC